jgi:uncharacterized membrane protein
MSTSPADFFQTFFQSYFVNPIIFNQGYNAINTSVYAIILVASAYIIYRTLRKLKIKIDRRLAISVAPYVLLGSSARLLVDSGLTDTFLLITPLIYFLIFAVTFSVLLISIYLERKLKIPYYKIMVSVGIALTLIPVSLLRIGNPVALAYVLGFYAIWPVVFYFIKWNVANKVVASIQTFDATNTSVALYFFGYSEQHVVPNIFISIFGPWMFVPIKAIAVIAALVLIDRYSDDKEFNNYLKLVIAILGGATSVRDFLRLVAGV